MNTNDFNLRENADIVALAMDASKSLDSRPLKEWFDKKYSSVEPRVFLINYDKNSEAFDNLHNPSDDDFMDEAELQGTVFTLEGFVKHFNMSYSEINQETDSIRIIPVPVFLPV